MALNQDFIKLKLELEQERNNTKEHKAAVEARINKEKEAAAGDFSQGIVGDTERMINHIATRAKKVGFLDTNNETNTLFNLFSEFEPTRLCERKDSWQGNFWNSLQ